MQLAFRTRTKLALLTAMTWVALTASTWAHPGHEGHEDGGEFVWTADHLSQHPGATFLCFALMGGLVWGLVSLLTVRSQPKADATHSLSAEKLS